MKIVVTGAAGFIGSHLCERLLAEGHHVLGIDNFVPYYPRVVKEANLAAFREHPGFDFLPLDLRTDRLIDVVRDAEAVFHLAAVPGLPRSWTEYDLYEGCNLRATQRLLDACLESRRLRKFVQVSTSSVYGRFAVGDELMPTRPISPYGVTKLAAENLARAYAEEQGLPLVVLRYFSVYGPRQRPDMGYYRFIRALLTEQPISVFGSGKQVRGNTYVADCVEATIAALRAPDGETYNVGGGEAVSLEDVLRKLERLTGRKAQVNRSDARPGDQQTTAADCGKLERHLGWKPTTGIDEGLALQVAWQKQLLRVAA